MRFDEIGPVDVSERRCVGRCPVGRYGGGQAACGLTPLRCSARGRTAKLATRLRRCAQTVAVSQSWKRASAPTPILRCSPPPDASHPAPPAATLQSGGPRPSSSVPLCRNGSGGWGLGGCIMSRRAAQGLRRRAQRASTSDSPRLFECSERSSRSEFCGAPQDRAAQGSRSRQAKTAYVAPTQLPPARAVAARKNARENQ